MKRMSGRNADSSDRLAVPVLLACVFTELYTTIVPIAKVRG